MNKYIFVGGKDEVLEFMTEFFDEEGNSVLVPDSQYNNFLSSVCHYIYIHESEVAYK